MRYRPYIILWVLYIAAFVVGVNNAEVTQYILAIGSFGLAIYQVLSGNYHNILLIMIAVGVIGSEITPIPNFAAFRYEDIIGFTIIPALLFLDIFPEKKRRLPNNLIWLLLAFILINIASITNSYLLGLSTFYIRDFTIPILYLKFLLIAVFAQRLIWTPEILKDFFVVICIVFGTSALFAIMQAFNVDLAINICQVFFASENVEELGRMGRQIGAGYNPNNFAKMMMMSYCVIFTVMFFFKKYRFLLLMLILTIIISIFSSGSRSGNTALIVVTFLILFLTLRKVSLLERIFFALVILPAFYFIFKEFFYMSNYIQNFFDILRNPYTDESFARRWQIGLPGSLEIFYTSPIFGIGPAKGSFQGFVDSEYYYILSRYGGAGIIWLFSFYFLVINNFYKLFKRSLGQNIEVKITGISFLVLNIGVMVTNIANNNIGGVPIVMSLYFTLLAIAYSYSSQILNSKMKSRL